MAFLAVSCGGETKTAARASKQLSKGSVSVSITTPAIATDAILDDNYLGAVGGTWSSSNIGFNQVYLQISDNAGTFATPGIRLASSRSFSYSLPLAGNVAAGPRMGTLTVRACKDAQCAQPYANASSSVNYQFQVFESTATVAIGSPDIVDDSVEPGDAFTATVAGTWTAAHLGSHKVYLQVSDDAGTFTAPEPQLAPAGETFRYKLVINSDLANTPRAGQLTVRACKDVLCTKPYAEAIDSINYQLQFKQAGDWQTHQRNAAHDGYVPITLDPSKFAKAWEWQRPAGTEPIGGINAVATSNGTVYVSTDVYFGDAKLFALNETSGLQRWTVSFGSVPGLNPPAFHDGRVYIATTGHENTHLWSFDASNGMYKFKSAFAGQWPHVLAPTAFGGEVYVAGGYYGGTVYAYDRLVGTSLWTGYNGGDDDMSTPAIDENNAYYHTGNAMVIWNRMTGALVANIPDPFATSTGYSYHGSPMLGGRDNVIAFAGSAFSGRASANVEHYEQRVLSSFNIGSKSWEWATPESYLTHPAVAKGVVYAARNNPMSLDAIDEATGQILWSWKPAATFGDTEFHRNIVVTRNLLFVSTNAGVYALDLETRTPAWRYPVPGMLAISADRTLYIASGARESNGKLIAIKLK